MPTLRLTQTALGEDRHRVEVALEGDGLARQIATVELPFRFAEEDQRDLRWYLEEYLQYPQEPNPKIAAGVEQRMAAIGIELFRAIFQGDARDLWATLRPRLEGTRVEIVTGVREATSIPWELLRDPKTDLPLALRARSFVRALPNPAEPPELPKVKAGTPLRTLLVICRPYGRNDVPFRSVSARILKSLDEEARQVFDLDVLRPPTFEALAETLRRARTAGKPYQIVHFDGHGAFLDMEKLLDRLREQEAEAERTFSPRPSSSTASAWRLSRPRRSTPTCRGRGRAAISCSRARRASASWMGRSWASSSRRPGSRCWCSTPAARLTPRPLRLQKRRRRRSIPTRIARCAPGARSPRR